MTKVDPEKGQVQYQVEFIEPHENIGYKNEVLIASFTFPYLFVSTRGSQILQNLVDDEFVPL